MLHSSRKSRAASLWLAAGEGDAHTSHVLLEEGDTQVMCCWRRVIHKLCCWRRVIHTRHMLLEKGDTQVVLLEEGDTHRSCAAAEGDRLIHTQVMSYACCWRRVIHAQVMSFAC